VQAVRSTAQTNFKISIATRQFLVLKLHAVKQGSNTVASNKQQVNKKKLVTAAEGTARAIHYCTRAQLRVCCLGLLYTGCCCSKLCKNKEKQD
jgi:hypothetical protein